MTTGGGSLSDQKEADAGTRDLPGAGRGASVTNMRRTGTLMTASLLLMAALSSRTLAQDLLAPIMTKQKIARQDRSAIETEVSDRVKKLADSRGSAKDRTRAREKVIAPAKIAGATKAALDCYAEVCGDRLDSLVTSENFEIAFDAIRVLIDLDNPAVAGALATALKSPYAAVRYRAARGLQLLHGKFEKNPDNARSLLDALGQAGAVEKDRLVLAMIYEVVDSFANVSGSPFGADCARALNTILASRVRVLDSPGFDELLDQAGFDAAGACYASATAEDKSRLAERVGLLLNHAVSRYFDPATAEEYLPTLSDLIKKAENTLRRMIQDSGQKAPNPTVSGELPARLPADKAVLDKKQQAAMAALDQLLAALK
jgi:hypothetical protein